MSHLRQSRATVTRDKGSRVKVANVTGRVARLCDALCRNVRHALSHFDFDARPLVARQSRATLSQV